VLAPVKEIEVVVMADVRGVQDSNRVRRYRPRCDSLFLHLAESLDNIERLPEGLLSFGRFILEL